MKVRLGGLLLCLLLCAGASAAPAAAKQLRLPLAHIGSFTEPKGLAFDQVENQVYAIDGRSEVQQVTVAATAGQFRLEFGVKKTGDLPFNANAEEVRDALRTLICPGEECIAVPGGQGDATGSSPYEILFGGRFATSDVEQLVCLPGTTPISGGSGCSVTTTVPGVNGTITRYNPDGSPANFEALGSNVIDGRGGADKVEPAPEGLHFSTPSTVQVVVDESSGATKGDIYVTQFGRPFDRHLLAIGRIQRSAE